MAMTSQEVFDTVARHLFAQGCRSVGGHRCLYRGPNGRKCAVGALIPDEEYKASFESLPVQDIAPSLESLAGVNIDLLAALQEAHDSIGNWTSSAAMISALSDVASEHGLRSSVLADVERPIFSRA